MNDDAKRIKNKEKASKDYVELQHNDLESS